MKICIVGCNGSIGKRHTNILKEMLPNADFTLCDKTDGFIDYTTVCNNEFDLVVICTPTSSHIKIASKFVNSKSFFIEKPIDSDLKTVKENLEFFKSKKTMIGCNLMFSKHMKSIKKHLPDCVFASVKAHTFLPEWRENYKELYSARKELGGGAINDYVHETSYVATILGLPNKIDIVKKRLKDYTIDTEDYVLFIFHYPDKVVNIECSYLCQDKFRSCDMVLNDGKRIIIDFSDGQKLQNQTTVSDIEETYKKQWKYFLKTESPINSYEDAFRLMETIYDQG